MNLEYQTFNIFLYIALFFLLRNLAKRNNLKVIYKKLFKGFSVIFLVLAILLVIPTSMRWYVKVVDAFITPSLETTRTGQLEQNVEMRLSNIIDLIKKDGIGRDAFPPNRKLSPTHTENRPRATQDSAPPKSI